MATETAAPGPVLIMGPTASGKTRLALELAGRMPVEIISVDSAMVYRDMDIGTAKPTREARARTPHHLIDICDPSEGYSAGRFRADALRTIEAVQGRGHVPLLVGGTGLYFRALEKGLSRLPPADAAVRARLDAQAAAEGWESLHRRLGEIDPDAAARIHPNDPQRIQRALEVFELTGRTLSQSFMEEPPAAFPHRLCKFVVADPDRERARARIAARFTSMLEEGFLAEMRALYERGDLYAHMPSMRLVGYRQGWAHLAGELDYGQMIRQAVIATQQLAKRQLTWFRREEGAEWLDACSPGLLREILAKVNSA